MDLQNDKSISKVRLAADPPSPFIADFIDGDEIGLIDKAFAVTFK